QQTRSSTRSNDTRGQGTTSELQCRRTGPAHRPPRRVAIHGRQAQPPRRPNRHRRVNDLHRGRARSPRRRSTRRSSHQKAEPSMTNDISQEFRAATEEYANRLAAKREAENNPAKTRRDNADAFKEHIEQQLAEQRANGTRININTL